jgi:hypothetical protein
MQIEIVSRIFLHVKNIKKRSVDNLVVGQVKIQLLSKDRW